MDNYHETMVVTAEPEHEGQFNLIDLLQLLLFEVKKAETDLRDQGRAIRHLTCCVHHMPNDDGYPARFVAEAIVTHVGYDPNPPRLA